jgi:hypothetical protein
MAKKEVKAITLAKNEAKRSIKPFCEESAKLADQKAKVEELRPLAVEELQAKLNVDPDTRDFTGTVVCMYDDKMYKIRVQRPDKTNWRSKRLDDANLREYKQIMKEIDAKKEKAEELVAQLAIDHPKCVNLGFTIAFLTK